MLEKLCNDIKNAKEELITEKNSLFFNMLDYISKNLMDNKKKVAKHITKEKDFNSILKIYNNYIEKSFEKYEINSKSIKKEIYYLLDDYMDDIYGKFIDIKKINAITEIAKKIFYRSWARSYINNLEDKKINKLASELNNNYYKKRINRNKEITPEKLKEKFVSWTDKIVKYYDFLKNERKYKRK